jgi:hypothetical protein
VSEPVDTLVLAPCPKCNADGVVLNFEYDHKKFGWVFKGACPECEKAYTLHVKLNEDDE